MVTGRISADAYVGQDGQPRASLNLTAMDMQFLGRRGEAEETPGQYPTEADDLPF